MTSPTARFGVNATRPKRPSLCSTNASCARQVKPGEQRTGTIGRGKWQRLPPAGSQPQRGVLQLWLGRRQRDGELAENLRVGVQRVARGRPVGVVELRPIVVHLWPGP